ncbi:MAG TPA: T9SS type A sorting domain-containing protein [Puia sp.]|nr:T9SS type A sorting domain-containing protein [Puia sp.]
MQQSKNGSAERIIAQVYPNPSRNSFNVELMSNDRRDLMMTLIDLSGTVLQQKKMRCYEGRNLISWDMNSYEAGAYFIVFENLDLKMLKIVKY